MIENSLLYLMLISNVNSLRDTRVFVGRNATAASRRDQHRRLLSLHWFTNYATMYRKRHLERIQI